MWGLSSVLTLVFPQDTGMVDGDVYKGCLPFEECKFQFAAPVPRTGAVLSFHLSI